MRRGQPASAQKSLQERMIASTRECLGTLSRWRALPPNGLGDKGQVDQADFGYHFLTLAVHHFCEIVYCLFSIGVSTPFNCNRNGPLLQP